MNILTAITKPEKAREFCTGHMPGDTVRVLTGLHTDAYGTIRMRCGDTYILDIMGHCIAKGKDEIQDWRAR